MPIKFAHYFEFVRCDIVLTKGAHITLGHPGLHDLDVIMGEKVHICSR